MSEYIILEKLGEGGMGQVFRAHHPALKRDVALKMISAGSAEDARISSRFRREVKLLCQLSHPHIVPVYDGGILAGRPYFAMELVEGEDLHALMEKEPEIPAGRALGWLRQLADALAYLHGERLMHRDVKPRNIILTRRGDIDHIMLVDFGLARTTTSAALTRPGEIVGTLAFLAPEVLESEAASFPLDVWSFGVTAFRLLAGVPLFREGNLPDLVQEILAFDLQEVDQKRKFDDSLSRAPAAMRALLARCLDRDPAGRPEFRTILESLEAMPPSGSPLPGTRARSVPEDSPGARPPVQPAPSNPPAPDTPHLRLRSAGAPRLVLPGAVLAAACGLLFLRSGPDRTPPAPAHSPSQFEHELSLPVNLLTLPSEKSLLVDFDLPDAEGCTVTVEGPGPPGREKLARTAKGVRAFHHIYRDLLPSSLYQITVEDDGGRRRLEDFRVFTHWSRLTDSRAQKYATLELPVGARAGLNYMEKLQDPEAIPPLLRYLQSAWLDTVHLQDIAHLAATFRHPTLTRAVLEKSAGAEDSARRAALLEAIASSRMTERRDDARAWISRTSDPALIGAAARVLGQEGRPGSLPLLMSRVEAAGGAVETVLEAMIRCDPATSRETFLTWIREHDSARRAAGAWGLDRLGEPRDIEALVQALDPTRTAGRPAGRAIVDEAIPFLADHATPPMREALARRLEANPTPRLLVSAARCGVPLPGAVTSVTTLSPELTIALALQQDPPELLRTAIRERASGPPGEPRDLATWILGQWRDPGVARLQERALAADQDPRGFALWARTRLLDPPPPPAFIEGVYAEIGRGPVRTLMRASLLWLLAHAADPTRAARSVPTVAGDPGASAWLDEIATSLDPSHPGVPGRQLVIFVTLGDHQRTDWYLRRGESMLVSGFGFRIRGGAGDSWERCSPPKARDPATGPSLVLRQGREEHFPAGWKSLLAKENGPVFLSMQPRGPLDQEPDSVTLTPGLAALCLDRVPSPPSAGTDRGSTP